MYKLYIWGGSKRNYDNKLQLVGYGHIIRFDGYTVQLCLEHIYKGQFTIRVKTNRKLTNAANNKHSKHTNTATQRNTQQTQQTDNHNKNNTTNTTITTGTSTVI